MIVLVDSLMVLWQCDDQEGQVLKSGRRKVEDLGAHRLLGFGNRTLLLANGLKPLHLEVLGLEQLSSAPLARGEEIREKQSGVDG